MKLVECVVNVSEGRDQEKLNAIHRRVSLVSNAFVLDVHRDADHNRSVFTLAGTPEGALTAAFVLTEVALGLLDIRRHAGVHPRIGVVDVVPFVPLRNVSMSDCVDLALRLAKRVATTFRIPVYLYEEAARVPERRNLAVIRRGQYEGLVDSIRSDPARRPDLGPAKMHPSAGAIAIGARSILIAFNVALDSDDVELAREIASSIRESGGGLAAVKALGLYLVSQQRAQISINLTDYRATSVYKVCDAIRLRLRGRRTRVAYSEIVGLVPLAALEGGDPANLHLNRPWREVVLENRIKEVTGWTI